MTRREIIRLSLLSSLAALACRKSPMGDTQPDEMTSTPEPLGIGPLLSSSSGLLRLSAFDWPTFVPLRWHVLARLIFYDLTS